MSHQRRFAALLAGAVLCFSSGCDDSASAEDVARLCQANCDRQARCGTVEADCLIKCHNDMDPGAAAYRSCFFNAATDCERNRPCSGVSGDACSYAGVQACGSVVNDSLYGQCMAVRSSCKSAGKPTYNDDYCAMVPALNDDARSRFSSCFNVACEQQSACAKAAFGD